MVKKKKHKGADGVVFSTNPDYDYNYNEDTTEETLSPNEQNLRIMRDKKQSGGKQVTLVTGFVGSEDDLKELGKLLKSKLGVGGSAKNGEIIIQGDFREKIGTILQSEGYTFKFVGG